MFVHKSMAVRVPDSASSLSAEGEEFQSSNSYSRASIEINRERANSHDSCASIFQYK